MWNFFKIECFRAKMFARDQDKIQTIKDMEEYITLNDYISDPLSKLDPGHAIASRWDLRPVDKSGFHSCHGATDGKGFSFLFLKFFSIFSEFFSFFLKFFLIFSEFFWNFSQFFLNFLNIFPFFWNFSEFFWHFWNFWNFLKSWFIHSMEKQKESVPEVGTSKQKRSWNIQIHTRILRSRINQCFGIANCLQLQLDWISNVKWSPQKRILENNKKKTFLSIKIIIMIMIVTHYFFYQNTIEILVCWIISWEKNFIEICDHCLSVFFPCVCWSPNYRILQNFIAICFVIPT